MKEILLNKGMKAIVDDGDYEKVKDFTYSVMPHGNNFYARRATYDKVAYAEGRKDYQPKRLMHRDILGLNDPKVFVDHKDGNGLNNQRSNLRICTVSQNMRNRKKNKNSGSQFKGVNHRIREGHKSSWDAQIGINGNRTHIGCFQTETEAALAYNFMAIHYFGEFARLNDVQIR